MLGAYLLWLETASDLRSPGVDGKATAVLIAVMVAVLLVNVAIILAWRRKAAAGSRATLPDNEPG